MLQPLLLLIFLLAHTPVMDFYGPGQRGKISEPFAVRLGQAV